MQVTYCIVIKPVLEYGCAMWHHGLTVGVARSQKLESTEECPENPALVVSAASLTVFKSRLKTYLFQQQSYRHSHWRYTLSFLIVTFLADRTYAGYTHAIKWRH